ncbi:unnamed protein product, partial [Heterosigma akashiwo]
IVGAFAIFAFIAVWISSLASPFILYASIRYQRYAITSVILVIFTCAYVPWEKGLFSKVFTAGVRLNVYYYKKCTQVFMGASLPSRGEEDGPKKNHKPKIYGVHPHGVFCLGWSILFCSPLMASVRFIFAPVLYASPFFRLWSRLTGNPGSADKASMIEYMKRREHLAIPPGGFEEATLSSPSHDRVYIKKRAGFVKLALQHGYNLVPVYVFGENKTYFNVQGGWKARLSLNSYSIPAIMAYGLSFLPILPRRNTQGLYIVVGDQLELPWIENPSREDVNHWHKLYISALVKLFDEHKVDAYGKEEGAEKKKLELW